MGDAAPSLTEGYVGRSAITSNFKVNYENNFGDHSLNAFVAIEQSETKFKEFSGSCSMQLSKIIMYFKRR